MSWSDKDGHVAGSYIGGTSYWMEPGNTYTSNSFIGLNNFMINGLIAINGVVKIDITTTANGVYTILPGATQVLITTSMDPALDQTAVMGSIAANSATVAPALTNPANLRPVTVVHISFPTDFIVDLQGVISATVDLVNTANFDTVTAGHYKNTMGDIYIQVFNITMETDSWVDIWAQTASASTARDQARPCSQALICRGSLEVSHSCPRAGGIP
jgi:hypothetical protein